MWKSVLENICKFFTLAWVTFFLLFLECAVILISITLAIVLVEAEHSFLTISVPLVFLIESIITNMILLFAIYVKRFRIKLIKLVHVGRFVFMLGSITLLTILLIIEGKSLTFLMILSGFVLATIIYRLFFTCMLATMIYNTNKFEDKPKQKTPQPSES